MKSNNELIAEFMGAEVCVTNTDYIVVPDKGMWMRGLLQYDSSWDWLMPVAKKIRNLKPISKKRNGVDSISEFINVGRKFKKGLLNVNIKEVHQGVIEFIKWYNLQIL